MKFPKDFMEEAIRNVMEEYGVEESDLTLRECVERQIPQKPYLWGDGYWDGELVIDTYDCPNCGKSYELECEEYDYCPNCGQKLDWSE